MVPGHLNAAGIQQPQYRIQRRLKCVGLQPGHEGLTGAEVHRIAVHVTVLLETPSYLGRVAGQGLGRGHRIVGLHLGLLWSLRKDDEAELTHSFR